jgi:hypothetical protein
MDKFDRIHAAHQRLAYSVVPQSLGSDSFIMAE